jgi:predicted acylesterase/phospholipase RssA
MIGPAECGEAVRAAIEASPQGPLDILALSGGGQWGAYGAGFLKGWTERAREPRRPAFHIVTGTSTGALIATYAFLGSDYDDLLRDAYLSIHDEEDVFEDRFQATAFLFKDALADTAPLRTRLQMALTPAILDAVAIEARRGRRLLAGSVDLRTAEFVAFDLTAIAASGGREAPRRYVDALMASTAVPVKFPPVYADEAVYVDGGVRRNVFVEEIARQLRRRRQAGSAAPGGATIYCLLNARRRVPVRGVPHRVLDIARRAVEVMLDETTDGNVLRVFHEARKAGMRFRLAFAPENACGPLAGTERSFDPKLMACLYDSGRATAREADEPWSDDPFAGDA